MTPAETSDALAEVTRALDEVGAPPGASPAERVSRATNVLTDVCEILAPAVGDFGGGCDTANGFARRAADKIDKLREENNRLEALAESLRSELRSCRDEVLMEVALNYKLRDELQQLRTGVDPGPCPPTHRDVLVAVFDGGPIGDPNMVAETVEFKQDAPSDAVVLLVRVPVRAERKVLDVRCAS